MGGRYRVLRYISRGAMGEVYEAEDTTLHGRVALKTVRPSVADSDKALDRFKREIHLARRVTHPNVTRIYDIGFHRPPGAADESDDVLFLTMELLQGETLSSLLERRGRLPLEEALPLIHQISAGLEAAHQSGIVHRDFKSANVIAVARTGSGSGAGPRAVVTDFGLARTVSHDDALSSISETGVVVGTPAYMAPEQVRGLPLTPAADIYAFGIVIYEMVTGVRPFTGDSGAGVAIKRLMEPPPSPRIHLPDLPVHWEETILRCLEKEPEARFPNASDVYRALAGQIEVERSAPRAKPLPRPPRRLPTRAIVIAATALVVLGAGAVFVTRSTPAKVEEPAKAATTVAARPTLALVGLKNVLATPEGDWLEVALGLPLSHALAVGSPRRVAPFEDVDALRRELAIADPRSVPAAALARLGEALHAELIVSGGYTVLDAEGAARVEVQVHDGSGKLLASEKVSGANPQETVQRLAVSLRKQLNQPPLTSAQQQELSALLPSSREAARAYGEGVLALRQHDVRRARERLEAAARLEPSPVINAARAEAHGALGEMELARVAATAVQTGAGGLGQETRWFLQARAAEAATDYKSAMEGYGRLFDAYPTDVRYGTRLALVQMYADEPRLALTTVQAVRKIASSESEPLLHVAEAKAHYKLSDSAAALASAGRAIEIATRRKNFGDLAEARFVESLARERAGDTQASLAAAEAARDAFTTAGDRDGVGRALVRIGEVLYARGDLEGSRRILERARQAHGETGNRLLRARATANLGTVFFEQGDLTSARKLLEEAVEAFRAAASREAEAGALVSLGSIAQSAGDLAGAQARYQQALETYDAIGSRRGSALALTNLGELLYLRGRLAESQRMHEEGLAANREIGDTVGLSYDMYRLGVVLTAGDDLNAAAKRFTEALGFEDHTYASSIKIAAARGRLAAGDAAEALKVAREAEEIARSQKSQDVEASARLAGAEALLALGKLDEARGAVKAADAACQASDDRTVRAECAVTSANVRSAGGAAEAAAAAAALAKTIAEMNRAGLVAHALEARLALGRARKAANDAGAAAYLTALAREANSKGFKLIARQAGELLKR